MRSLFLVAYVVTCPLAVWAADNRVNRPTFPQITATVNGLFAAEKDYRPGDLISRSQAQKVMKALAALGFAPADEADILAKVLADDSFLVATSRTPEGKTFLRKLAPCKEAYDRLDRLSRLPHGQQSIRELINAHGGDEVVRYMAKDPGGRKLIKQLGPDTPTADFDKPTGHIYTADALLAALKASYDAAAKKPAK